MTSENKNPYATPESSINNGELISFLSPFKRAALTIKAFYAVIAVQTAYILVQLWRKPTFIEYAETGTNLAEIERGDQVEALVAILLLIVTLTLVVLFLRWFYLCYKNLTPLQVGNLDHTPGWAVGWFFVPFANLVKPYSVAYEMWYSSEAKDKDYGNGSSWVVVVWWIFFIVSSGLARYVMRKTEDAEYIEDLIELIPIDIASSMVSIIGAYFAINFVKRLTQRQDDRYQSL